MLINIIENNLDLKERQAMFNVGDYVVRVSYHKDILFKIVYIAPNQIARLKGVSYRIIADAPLSDLEPANNMRYTSQEDNIMIKVNENVTKILKQQEEKKKGQNPSFQKTGTVLHIDGDAFYLNLCLKYYKELGIPAVGEHVAEAEQPKRIRYLLDKYSPDILVLTGHDALNKNHKGIHELESYRNSGYFIEAVKKARMVKASAAELVIFAGACQSYFEEILAAGADFAASPGRVLIHALDPVFIVEKIAHCPFYQVLPIDEALENTITNIKGLGGYEVLGKCRKGGPVVEEDKQEESALEKQAPEQPHKTTQNRAGNKKCLTKNEIEKELAKPLFNDSMPEFEVKMQRYMNRENK